MNSGIQEGLPTLRSTGSTLGRQKRQSQPDPAPLTELVGGFPNPPPEGALKGGS
jgi:hypothetical protein